MPILCEGSLPHGGSQYNWGDISYPPVETIHTDNTCHLVFAPLRAAFPDIASRARKITGEAVMTFTGAGIYGVQLFLPEDGEEYTQVYRLNSECIAQEIC